MSEPEIAREAELLTDYYDVIRRALTLSDDATMQATDTPDYYAVLNVPAGASYADIERAYRDRSADAHSPKELIAQAWRVLGDPLNRASYDRTRRESIDALGDPPTEPSTHIRGTSTRMIGHRITYADTGQPGRGSHVEIPGTSVRPIRLKSASPLSYSLPVLVRGETPWKGQVACDHPGIRVRPSGEVDLSPGEHDLEILFAPRQFARGVTMCRLTLTHDEEHCVVMFEVRNHASASRPSDQIFRISLAIALVALGWLLGARYTEVFSRDTPASLGSIALIPTTNACFDAMHAPLPSWLDVHTDGLGRLTGFSFGGPASRETEDCVKKSLLKLRFPRTANGRPVFHRYRIPPLQESP